MTAYTTTFPGPTEEEVRALADRLHAEECSEPCPLGVTSSWLDYARDQLTHEAAKAAGAITEREARIREKFAAALDEVLMEAVAGTDTLLPLDGDALVAHLVQRGLLK